MSDSSEAKICAQQIANYRRQLAQLDAKASRVKLSRDERAMRSVLSRRIKEAEESK